MEHGDYRNWTELPPELTSSILIRLGAVEILENAQKVCRSWRRVCKDPSMWRKIVIDNRGDRASFKYDLESMCRHAVDRSQGGLLEIDIEYFGTDKLLDYIADRFSLSLSSPCNSKSLELWFSSRGIFEFLLEHWCWFDFSRCIGVMLVLGLEQILRIGEIFVNLWLCLEDSVSLFLYTESLMNALFDIWVAW